MRLHISRLHTISFAACLTTVLVAFPGVRGQDDAKPDDPPAKKPDLTAVGLEARLVDDSSLRVTLREQNIQIITQYGKITVPLTEIRRIDFATRVPDDILKKIDDLVAKLADPQEKVRDEASTELIRYKTLALPALQNASKSGIEQVAKRAEELLERIRESMPEDQFEFRKNDVIHTDDMKIAGKIDMTALKVHTRAFGEVPLKLTELRSLSSTAEAPEEAFVGNVMADPGTVVNLSNNVGQKFAFRVTGVATGTIWGTDTYTTDSRLAMAAVHAGVLKVGQTSVVRVAITGNQANFTPSTRNGITSHAYGAHPAFKILK